NGTGSDNLDRHYNSFQIQGAYRWKNHYNFGGNYTWSKLRGNVEGETFNNATVFLRDHDLSRISVIRSQSSDGLPRRRHSPPGKSVDDHRDSTWLRVTQCRPAGALSLRHAIFGDR